MRKETSVWNRPELQPFSDRYQRDWDMAESHHAYHLWLEMPPDCHPRVELNGRELRVHLEADAAPRVFQLPPDIDGNRAHATFGDGDLELWLPKGMPEAGAVHREIAVELPARQAS